MKTYNLKNIKSKDLNSIIREIKDEVTIVQVINKLQLDSKLGLQQVGNNLQGNCPTGHPSKGGHCFSANTVDNLYFCFNCGVGGDIVELVALVNGTGRFAAVKWLAENFVPRLIKELDSLKDNISDERAQLFQRSNLYNAIYDEGKRRLFEDDGKEVLEYLVKERGYDPEILKSTDFIYWDTKENIRGFLHKKFPDLHEQIEDLILVGGYGDTFRLGIPFRDRYGTITGFLKRAHKPAVFVASQAGPIRWDSTKGLEKPDLFGLSRIHKMDTVIVVEGYPDATYLYALGLTNIVACGQAIFSEKYIEGLRVKGVSRIVLALDNDGGTGEKNSEGVCRLLANSDIQVFVLDPPAMGAHKDPDEYVKANGMEAFREIVSKAELGSEWMTKRILKTNKITLPLGREKAIAECLEYADELDNPREAEGVLRALTATLGITDEVLAEEFKKLQAKKAAEHLSEGVAELARQANKLIVAGDPEKAIKVLQNETSNIQSEYWRSREPEKENLDDFLVEKRKRDSQRVAGQRIGYELKDFAEIDHVISGLQSGLYIIGADPNIGKTALMVSLTIDVLHANPDASCLFYSMDDSRDAIVNRMLAHLTDKKINEVRFKLSDQAEEIQLDNAYAQMTKWFQDGRLDIREATAYLTMSRIQSEIQMHENRGRLVVFIDGLYNVPVDTDSPSLREQNIDRATQLKQLVRLFAIPVIATAEFRKQGRDETSNKQKERTINDIMETGKYGYNADLIILLTPKDPDNYRDQAEPIIVADFGKNKLESFRGKMEFTFIRAKSVMTFVKGSTSNS